MQDDSRIRRCPFNGDAFIEACAAEGLGLSESLEWLEARVGACERTERLARRAR